MNLRHSPIQPGREFGGLKVIAEAGIRTDARGHANRYWLCICQCGKEVEVKTAVLNAGQKRSCGCRLGKTWNRLDLTGQKFGKLTVLAAAASRYETPGKVGYWLCRCECDKQLEVPTNNLRSGNTTSCGHDRASRMIGNRRAETHGQVQTPTWRTWFAMRKRCRDKPGYAGRIQVDPRWDSFDAFLADMGERPEGTTLDRIDNEGDYTVKNCRWASPEMQGNNRRNNRHVTYQGRTQTIAQWAKEFGLSKGVLFNRIQLYGWEVERALTTPVRPRYGPRS